MSVINFRLFSGKPKETLRKARTDLVLLFLVYLIAFFGVFAVAVATFDIYSDPDANLFNQIASSSYSIRQSIFLILSPFILGVLLAIPYEMLRARVGLIFGLSVGLLVVALAGESIAGINAFISIIWGFTIQPAEFAKIALVLALAAQLEDLKDPFRNMKTAMRFLLTVGAPAGITIMQGEMGSAMVMAAIVVFMLFVAGMDWKRFLILIAIGVAAMVGLVLFWSLFSPDSYRLQRIIALVNPDKASEATKYQVNNSLIAIGSGGLTGIGPFKQGSIAQLDYVPKDWTDFIFSAVGETFGFVGSVAVILAYFALILRLLFLAKTAQDKFSELIITGIMTMFLTHVFLNVGMTIGVVPVVGIPLPFLSYGGSNMTTNMVGIGLVLNVTKNIRLTESNYDSRYIERNL